MAVSSGHPNPPPSRSQPSIVLQDPGCSRRTVKLSDLICWRSLAGRPCFPPGSTSDLDVVIVPIPAAAGNARKQRQTPITTSQGVGSTIPWHQLLTYCHQLAAVLDAAGMAVHVDSDHRATPGAKYFKWEAAGVPVRVEVGTQELTTNTATLAVLPSAAAQTLAAQPGNRSVPGNKGGKVTRHRGVTQSELVNKCSSIVTAARGSTGQSAPVGPLCTQTRGCNGLCALVATADLVNSGIFSGSQQQGTQRVQGHHTATATAGASHHLAATVSEPDPRCGKLHLWPGANLPNHLWSQQGLLQLVPQVPHTFPVAPTPGAPATDQPQPWQSSDVTTTTTATTAGSTAGMTTCLDSTTSMVSAQLSSGFSAAEGAEPRLPATIGHTGSAEGMAADGRVMAPVLVCAEHVRCVLGLGQACHCDVGHVSMEAVCQEVERCVLEQGMGMVAEWVLGSSTGGDACSGRVGCEGQGKDPVGSDSSPDSDSDTDRDTDSDTDRGAGSVHRDPPAGGQEGRLQQSTSDTAALQRTQCSGGTRLVSADQGGKVTLGVSCLPTCVPATVLQRAVGQLLAPLGACRVRVGRGQGGVSLGWGRITAPAHVAAELLDLLNGASVQVPTATSTQQQPTVATTTSTDGNANNQASPTQPSAHDGALRCHATHSPTQADAPTSTEHPQPSSSGVVVTFPLRVSPSCGRRDALFADVPCARVRSRMRVDPTAAYSVTDAATADAMTEVLLCVVAAQRSLDLAPLPAGNGRCFVDGTACAGGNTLALLRHLRTITGPPSSVTSVEFDPDRAQDLVLNLRLLGWVPPPGGTPCHAAEGHVTTTTAPTPGHGSAVDGSREEQVQGNRVPDVSPTPAVRVLCGDYTSLWSHLPDADCVILDPPWGGPQYQQTATTNHDATPTLTALQGTRELHEGTAGTHAVVVDEPSPVSYSGGVATPQHALQVCQGTPAGVDYQGPVSHRAAAGKATQGQPVPLDHVRPVSCSCQQGPGMKLGSTPLCALTGALLGSGSARVVALKLPGSGAPLHAEMLACAARHAQQADGGQTGLGQLWAVRVSFGRTCLLLVVALPPSLTCEQQDGAHALRSAVRAWAQRRGVAYQVLGRFS